MSQINDKALNGLPIDDVLIFDAHCHIGNWHNFNIPENSAEGMLKSMDRIGINTAFITAHSSIGPDYRYGNNMVIEVLKHYPERFIGYVTVNPNYPDDMKTELDRCFQNKNMKGIKLHPWMHGRRCDHHNYHNAYETANARRCPVLIHTGGAEDVCAIDELAGSYSNAIFIIGHGGADLRGMEKAIDTVNKHNNVYVDTAISMAFEGNIEWFVKEIGESKILFGSDMPFYDPRPTFGRIALADISDEAKRSILGENLLKILNNNT